MKNREARQFIKETIDDFQKCIKESDKNTVIMVKAEELCKILVEIRGLME